MTMTSKVVEEQSCEEESANSGTPSPHQQKSEQAQRSAGKEPLQREMSFSGC